MLLATHFCRHCLDVSHPSCLGHGSGLLVQLSPLTVGCQPEFQKRHSAVQLWSLREPTWLNSFCAPGSEAPSPTPNFRNPPDRWQGLTHTPKTTVWCGVNSEGGSAAALGRVGCPAPIGLLLSREDRAQEEEVKDAIWTRQKSHMSRWDKGSGWG